MYVQQWCHMFSSNKLQYNYDTGIGNKWTVAFFDITCEVGMWWRGLNGQDGYITIAANAYNLPYYFITVMSHTNAALSIHLYAGLH